MSLLIPKSFPFSKLAPTLGELEWIYDWIRFNIKLPCSVLEFGCGVTTYAIYSAITNDFKNDENCKLYVAVEDWPQCVRDTMKHVPKVKIITTTWYSIDEVKYDLVFVDSSAGFPPATPGLHRHQAIQYAEKLNDQSIFIIHDWYKKSGKMSRKYFEENNYKLLDSFIGRTGVGIYKKQ